MDKLSPQEKHNANVKAKNECGFKRIRIQVGGALGHLTKDETKILLNEVDVELDTRKGDK